MFDCRGEYIGMPAPDMLDFMDDLGVTSEPWMHVPYVAMIQ